MIHFPFQFNRKRIKNRRKSCAYRSILLFFVTLLQHNLLPTSSFALNAPLSSASSSYIAYDNFKSCRTLWKNQRREFFSHSSLYNKDPKDSYNEGSSSSSLKEQIQKLQIQILETELSRPPHHPPNLTPHHFIVQILQALYAPHYPMDDSGFRVLLRSSTMKWRRSICQSIGLDIESFRSGNDDGSISWDEDKIAQALGKALSSPRNQFGVLVGPSSTQLTKFSATNDTKKKKVNMNKKNCNHMNDSLFMETLQNRNYKLTFPSDIVDFNDGTCWLECRLLDPKNGNLMVIMGWQLKRQIPDDLNVNKSTRSIKDRKNKTKPQILEAIMEHGSWYIDGLDWQDFRDRYRPGLGREEWMRICG